MNTKYVAEIATDEQGNLLWIEQWAFNHMYVPGGTFIKDYKEYEVIRANHVTGLYGGALVEHVCKLIKDRTLE